MFKFSFCFPLDYLMNVNLSNKVTCEDLRDTGSFITPVNEKFISDKDLLAELTLITNAFGDS